MYPAGIDHFGSRAWLWLRPGHEGHGAAQAAKPRRALRRGACRAPPVAQVAWPPAPARPPAWARPAVRGRGVPVAGRLRCRAEAGNARALRARSGEQAGGGRACAHARGRSRGRALPPAPCSRAWARPRLGQGPAAPRLAHAAMHPGAPPSRCRRHARRGGKCGCWLAWGAAAAASQLSLSSSGWDVALWPRQPRFDSW